MVSNVTSTLAYDSVGEMCWKFNVIHEETYHMSHILRIIIISSHPYQRLHVTLIN